MSNDLLASLKFVQGAVAKKDFVPELCHFHIKDGQVKGYNGILGISCPIALNLDVTPNATQFVKAIQTCKETVALHVTDGGRLAIKSGKFRAFIDCIPGDFPEVGPEGIPIKIENGILPALKILAPFIAEDASRQWARGILLRGDSAFATNNVALLQYWLGSPFPIDLNIPKAAVAELLRIGEEPVEVLVADASVTFKFEGDRWLRTQTYDLAWPDVTPILDRPSTQQTVPDGLWEAVEDLSPFVDDIGRLFLSEGKISTSTEDGAGASVDIANPHAGCYHFKQLALLSKVVQTIDLSCYPLPALFTGDRIRGALSGIRY